MPVLLPAARSLPRRMKGQAEQRCGPSPAPLPRSPRRRWPTVLPARPRRLGGFTFQPSMSGRCLWAPVSDLGSSVPACLLPSAARGAASTNAGSPGTRSGSAELSPRGGVVLLTPLLLAGVRSLAPKTIAQAFAFDVGHGEPQAPTTRFTGTCLARIVYREDVGVLQPGGGANFAAEALWAQELGLRPDPGRPRARRAGAPVRPGRRP